MTALNEQSQKAIIQNAEKILFAREEEGFDAALALWKELDQELENHREDLSDELLDLVLQVEFLMEGDPMADLSNARHALYVAQVTLKKRH